VPSNQIVWVLKFRSVDKKNIKRSFVPITPGSSVSRAKKTPRQKKIRELVGDVRYDQCGTAKGGRIG